MGVLRFFSFLFGLFFLAIGVLGFMPDYVPDGLLFGYFQVDNTLSLIHIISGVLGLLAAAGGFLSKLYLMIFGIIYAILAVAGFVMAGDLSITQVNMADNILHLGIGVVALYLGFIFSS